MSILAGAVAAGLKDRPACMGSYSVPHSASLHPSHRWNSVTTVLLTPAGLSPGAHVWEQLCITVHLLLPEVA